MISAMKRLLCNTVLTKMFISSAVFLLVFLSANAKAHSREHNKNLNIGHILKYVHNIISDEILQVQPYGSQFSVHKSLQAAETILNRIQRCGPETKLELLQVAYSSLGEVQGCINATRDIADFEVLSYHTYQYIMLSFKNIYNVTSTAVACHTQPNIYEVLKCIITTMQSSGPKFDEIFASALDLVTETQDIVGQFIQHVKNCFTFNKTAVYKKIFHLLHNRC